VVWDRGNHAGFRLHIDGLGELQVVRFSGTEGVSSLFELRVEVAGEYEATRLMLGREATLTIDGAHSSRHIHGVVCQAEYIGDSRRLALHELLIVPWIWRLQQRVDARIFQNCTTPEILARILDSAGLARRAYRIALGETYAPRDYCVQYGESDLDFFHRLCEAEGIVYYFDHEPTQHVLVLTDRRKCGAPPEGAVDLRWDPLGGGATTDEHVTRFRHSEAVRPERVTLRDHNLHSPATALTAHDGAGREREVYEYPGGYQQTGRATHQGGSMARLRLEALRASASRGFGTSDSPRLVPGYAFQLAGHRWPDLDGEYQVLRVSHRGEQPQVLAEATAEEFHYSNEFECTPVDVPFRAPRVTPRPVVRGVQTATVVGPASEEIAVDEHGRVKVQFHWDRRDAHDETSSCWVRVSQAWAGDGYGSVFLPRIGHEVIVDFIEGDPDRPIITGRIYTGSNRPPHDVVQDKSRSTIKTETTPGGGGFNELRFEDARGREELYLHAQRDMNTEVLHDQSLIVGNDRTRTVGRDERATIERDVARTVGGSHTEDIAGRLDLSVGADRSERVGAGMTLQVAENLGETAGQNIILEAGKHLIVRTGESVSVSAGRSAQIVVASRMTIQCGATTIDIDAAGAVKISSTTLDVQASGAVKISGATLKFN
jgi:type VI secretion system secreted protein VgrG